MIGDHGDGYRLFASDRNQASTPGCIHSDYNCGFRLDTRRNPALETSKRISALRRSQNCAARSYAVIPGCLTG
jgi:hypothetical protein